MRSFNYSAEYSAAGKQGSAQEFTMQRSNGVWENWSSAGGNPGCVQYSVAPFLQYSAWES